MFINTQKTKQKKNNANIPPAHNKLTSVFCASVLLLIMNFVVVNLCDFHHNIVRVVCGSTRRWPSGSADYFDNVMMRFIVDNRTEALKTDINLFFTITNCRIARSRSQTRRMNFKFMFLSAY